MQGLRHIFFAALFQPQVFESKCLSRIRVEMMRASYFARESHRQRRGSLREGPAGVDSAMFWVIEIKLPFGLNAMT